VRDTNHPDSDSEVQAEAGRRYGLLVEARGDLASLESVRGLAIIRTGVARSIAWMALGASPLGLVVGVSTWTEAVRQGWPTWEFVTTGGIGVFVYVLVVVAGAYFLSPTFGVAPTDRGLAVLTGSLKPGRLRVRMVGWETMISAGPTGMLGRSVMIDTDSAPVWLTAAQARAVFTDARNPMRGMVTPEVRRRVGIRD
jgi:hypothetical protein